MFLANIETPELKSAAIAFSNVQYPTPSPARIFVEGIKGVNRCKVLSNLYSVNKDNYTTADTVCSAAYYGYCELNQPRGKLEYYSILDI